MKKFTALLGFLLSFNVLAHADIASVTSDLGISTDGQGKCEYSKEELIDVYLSKRFGRNEGDKPLVLSSSTNLSPFWECIFLSQNFKRDMSRKDNIPSIDEVFADSIHLPDQEFTVEGKIRYMGAVPKKYKYDVKIENGFTSITVKIHFTKADSKQIAYRLKLAEDNWNDQLRKFSRNFKFNFKIVEDKKDAHFSVKLVEGPSRGPYDSTWSTYWSQFTMTHEIGHMLGLDDEYNNLETTIKRGPSFLLQRLTGFDTDPDDYKQMKSMQCDMSSFMCDQENYQARISKVHYYLVLSRVFQESNYDKK